MADMTAKAVEAARRYYDTDDVNSFYTTVWGGEDIHIGIYAHRYEAIATASRRTVETMAALVANDLGPGSRVLDLGSGYGGPARYLASRFGCRVVALNISGVQNRRHHEINVAQGLDGLVDVVTGSFEDLPVSARRFDLVWSQDAFSHSDSQATVLAEVLRVLKPEGRLVFTDLMADDGVEADLLRPVVARTCVEGLPTPRFYLNQLARLGFAAVEFADHSQHLLTHYQRITEETQQHMAELVDATSHSYVESLVENLTLWVNACRSGHLRWGIFLGRLS